MHPVIRNETDIYEIGEKIRNRRRELNLSQDDLADRMSSDGNSVSRHENGMREMKISLFCQYADALETNAASLLPDRVQEKVSGKQEQLLEAVSGLSDIDMDLLISMARRLKH